MENKNTFPLVGFFLVCLALIFITLKLTNVIDWDWWIILSPCYSWLCVFCLVLFLAFLIGIGSIISKK